MAIIRRTVDRNVDRAHAAIADAEMLLEYSFTECSKAAALAALAAAQDTLTFAVAARDAWNARAQ